MEEQLIRLTETITIKDSPIPAHPKKISKPIFIDLGEEPWVVTLGSADEEEASRMNKQGDVTPQPSKESGAQTSQTQKNAPLPATSTAVDGTIADEILREARINFLNPVFPKKAAAPVEEHEHEPPR